MSRKQRSFCAWFLIIFIITTPYLYAVTIGKQKPTVQLFKSVDLEVRNKYLNWKVSSQEEKIGNQSIMISQCESKVERQGNCIKNILNGTYGRQKNYTQLQQCTS